MNPEHKPTGEEQKTSTVKSNRFVFSIWVIFAVLILAIVLVYDRRAINDAKVHIEVGNEYMKAGKYGEAVLEFEEAFTNKRLSRKSRATVALSLANLYYDHLQDYPSAYRYYVQARQLSPGNGESNEIVEKEKDAQERSKGFGRITVNTKSKHPTVINKVELISEPILDKSGPVLVNYEGSTIHAGAFWRQLKTHPQVNDPAFRNNLENIENLLNEHIDKELAYQAAIKAGVQNDPDISEKLYDYQKNLITQRFLEERFNQSQIVTNEEVKHYYSAHISDYVATASLALSLIVLDNETSASEVSRLLQDGKKFADVATSYTIDKQSAFKNGQPVNLFAGQTSIGDLITDKSIIDQIWTLPTNSPTEPVRYDNKYLILNVTAKNPGKTITLDQARAGIERTLRGQKSDTARNGVKSEVRNFYKPQIVMDSVNTLWNFVNNLPKASDNTSRETTQSLAVQEK